MCVAIPLQLEDGLKKAEISLRPSNASNAIARYVVTDVTKDGTLKGPNLELLREVCAATGKPVIASGGISSLADIAALNELRAIGVEGAIVGKALYAGAFTLEEALALTKP
jgi:phosphoribosylformimino-5-aminoimidazole carboxamide ribotide isomerase/phosphoribosylanthranilate isomerase